MSRHQRAAAIVKLVLSRISLEYLNWSRDRINSKPVLANRGRNSEIKFDLSFFLRGLPIDSPPGQDDDSLPQSGEW